MTKTPIPAAHPTQNIQPVRATDRSTAAKMAAMLAAVLASGYQPDDVLPLLSGTGADKVHLLIIIGTDRGLCGGFNTQIFRAARRQIRDLEEAGKTVKLLCIGRKARDVFSREFGKKVIASYTDITRKGLNYDAVAQIASRLQDLLAEGAFDVCQVLYNKFRSAMVQTPTWAQVIPLSNDDTWIPESEIGRAHV